MSFPIDIYVIQAIHGLVYGMLLFLVASGLTLVFGMMGVLNLSHAGFFRGTPDELRANHEAVERYLEV